MALLFRILLAASIALGAALLFSFYLALIKVKSEKVPGTYRAEYEFGSEEFEIKKTGTYLQKIRLSGDPRIIEKRGSWIYDSTDGQLILVNPFKIVDGFGNFIPGFQDSSLGLHVISICYNMPFGRLGFCYADLPIHRKISP